MKNYSVCMGESFQDYSESQPQNPELGRLLWLLFDFSLSNDN